MQHCLFARSLRGKDLINLLQLLLAKSQTFQMGNMGRYHQFVLQQSWRDCSRQISQTPLSMFWGSGKLGISRLGRQEREQSCLGMLSRRGQKHPPGQCPVPSAVEQLCLCLQTCDWKREDVAAGGASDAPQHVPVIFQTVYLRVGAQLCWAKLSPEACP